VLCCLQAQTRAQSIVNELFPPGVSASVQPGAILDALVTQLSQEMIDDYPASDPRWADSLPPGHYYYYLLHQQSQHTDTMNTDN